MPNYVFDISKLTNVNTHGDYNISQLIVDVDKRRIDAVIDWTTACVHPAIWEIFRFYFYASPYCINGEINTYDFINYIRKYMLYGTLNEYDLENMGKLFFYFTAVCNFYGQYYNSTMKNREVYLKQAQLSSKLLKWFDENIDAFTKELKRKVNN